LSEVTSSGEIKKSMIEERKPVASGYKGEWDATDKSE
jgi:hypothetical protein